MKRRDGRPTRPITAADLREQRKMLLEGGSWEEQEEIPARPWSPEIEWRCERVRRELEEQDWLAERMLP